LISAQEQSNEWEENNAFVWEYQFESGFISTSPLFTGEEILVRTSGNSGPAVTGFDLAGEILWQRVNNHSTNNDMSPLLYVSAGQGECGSWPEMVLVGWTDGRIEALLPSNGELFWSAQSEVAGWGVTGEFALDDEFVIVPTRKGVGQYCLADGEQQWWSQTGLAWRNGVEVAETGYFLGDESGTLWHVDREGETISYPLGLGKIRHAPLFSDAGLLVHAQAPSSSTVVVVDVSDGSVSQQFPAGSSPAKPSLRGSFLVTGDSSSIQIFSCTTLCESVAEVPFHTNGELRWLDDELILAPSNTPDSNWGMFTFDGLENLTLTSIDIGIYGYGTAAPLQFVDDEKVFTVFGNDQALLRVFSRAADEEAQPQPQPQPAADFDWGVQGLVFIMFLLIGSSTILILNGKVEWFFRTSSLFFLILFLLILPDLSSQWSKAFDEQFPADAVNEQWNDQWPEAWMDTQIVIIEIDGEEQVVGGLTGHETVYSLTQDACEQLGFELGVELTEIGYYIESINGIEANGWEYFTDGSKGVVSVDSASIQSSVIVRWTPV
jgi:hypothetical protein